MMDLDKAYHATWSWMDTCSAKHHDAATGPFWKRSKEMIGIEDIESLDNAGDG